MKFHFALSGLLLAGLMSTTASAALSSYSQDFEALTLSPDNTTPTQLGGNTGDNWLVGANVFASDGTTFLYNYFAFPAPNHGGAFSAVVGGEGGAAQGAQQLSVFSDYNNVGSHGAGDRIESNVFRDIGAITPGDVGTTWYFSFDAKAGNIGLSPASTATAFIKALNSGFGVEAIDSVATEGLGSNWTGDTLSLTIPGSAVGGLLQIGFTNTASNFDSSGMFYDNINVSMTPPGVVVPEPSSLAALAIGSTMMVVRRRRRS